MNYELYEYDYILLNKVENLPVQSFPYQILVYKIQT